MANTPFTIPSTSVDEKQNKKIWQGLIALLISYAIIINLMAPILAWQWTQLPFLGILFERDLVVSSSYSSQWLTYQNAEKAGITLNKPVTLIAIDEQPVYTAQDIQNILISQSLGNELKLTLLDSDSQDSQSESPSEQHLKAVVTRFPWADAFIFFGIPYLCGLAYLALGLSVYRLKQSQEIHVTFLAFCALVSVILGGAFDLYTYHYFTLIWTLTLPFVPATLIHFSLVFPLEVKFIRQRAWARYVPYILAFGLATTGLISLLNFSSRLNHLIVWSLDFTYLGIGLLTFFGIGGANWYVNYSSTIRHQLQIMLGGGVLAFAPVLVWSLGPLTTGQILLLPQTFHILVITPAIFFPLAITYAILRYQVSNLDSIFKTALLYVSLIFLVLVIYSGLAGLSRIFLNMSLLTNPITLFFCIAILVILATIALENTRLLQEANYKAHQLTTINEVGHLISATLERDKSLNLTLETAVEILNSEAGSIFLVNHTNQTLIFEVALGPTGLTLIGSKMAMDMNSIAGSIAVTRQAMVVNNVAQDARWNSNIDKTTEFQTRDILGVPMIAFGRVVGVIEVINKKNGDGYNENDLMMLTLFATQAGVAIVNAERFTQTDQALASRMQELSTLRMIDRELNATLDFEAVLDLTLSRTMDALGAMIGLIAIVDAEEKGLIFHSHVGVAKKFERFTETPWPLDRGIIGQVARTGQALIANEEHMDIFASDGRSNSQLCVPLMLDETVMGVINLEIADFDPFTEQDLDFAKRLASHASLAVQNSRLFEQVKQANQAKTEFMDVASHDLKTPMTSIKGFARMILMTSGSEMSDTQKEFINIIIKNVDRMARLVSDLLDVSRIEAGRIALDCKDMDLKEAIDDVVQSAQAEVQEKNLEMRLEVSQNLPPIWADYDRIVQVLTNLVSNAYKYTPEGGQITIQADVLNGQPASHLSIKVIDTGYGISEEDQKKLFDKFFRSSDPNVSDVPGTGLGLAITKNMIEMHGGQMWFKSKVGEGSTFGFDMPIQH